MLLDPQKGIGLIGFWEIVTAKDFQHALGGYSIPELLGRGKAICLFLVKDGVGLPLALLPLLYYQRLASFSPLFWSFVYMAGVNSGFVANYSAFEAHTMLLPTCLALNGLMILLLHKTFSLQIRWLPIFWLIALGAGFWNFHALSPRTLEAFRFADQITAFIPTRSQLMVSNDIEFRPIWYRRIASAFRPDLGIRIVDRADDRDIAEMLETAARVPLFGSLVFPPNLGSRLREEGRVVPMGMVSRVFPRHSSPPSLAPWQQTPLTQCDMTTFSLKIFPARSDEFHYSNTDQQTFFYRYSFEKHSDDVASFCLGVFLQTKHGTIPSHNGVLLSHDYHEIIPGNSLWNQGNTLYFLRSIWISSLLPPGDYQILAYVVPHNETHWSSLFAQGFTNPDPLNEEGELELFRLRSGLGDRTLVHAAKLDEFLRDSSMKKTGQLLVIGQVQVK
jgi:hypothetical protein